MGASSQNDYEYKSNFQKRLTALTHCQMKTI